MPIHFYNDCFRLEYSYRLNEKKLNFLPKIPAQVIGYSIAYKLFKLMAKNKNPVPDNWQGDLNITYTFGGKLDNNK
jgi:hypothetical protein